MKKGRFFVIHGLILTLFVLAVYLSGKKAEYRNFWIGLAEILALIWCVLFLSFLTYCFLRERSELFARFGGLWQAVTKEMDKRGGEKVSFAQRLRILILPLFGIGYMIFYFGVTELYFANRNEWLFSYRSIFPTAVSGMLIWIILLTLVFALLLRSRETAARGAVTFSSLFLAMYLQNLLLNGNGFIGGDRPGYSYFDIMINLLLWGGICFGAHTIGGSKIDIKKRVRICLGLCAMILVMQLVPLPMFFASGKDAGTTVTEPGLVGTDQFVLSDDKNVVVFVMDAYWKGFFEEYLTDHEDAYSRLADFTYYDNVNTKALHTAFSLPYFLTASDVDFSVPLRESNRRAWQGENSERFYRAVHDLGYRVYLYTDSADYAGGAKYMDGKIENIEEISYEARPQPLSTYSAMVKLSAYRYMPCFLKDFFFVFDSAEVNRYTKLYYFGIEKATNDRWGLSTAEAFWLGTDVFNHDYLNDLQKGLQTDASGKRIVIEHIFGMHPPQFELDGTTETDFKREEEICMEILYRYMEELKRLGIYDRTCIIVTADHGYEEIKEGDPLMLVKGFDEHGESLAVNQAPGCLQTDFLPTILDLIGGDPSMIEGGTSLLEIPENDIRERVMREYVNNSVFPPAPKCDSEGSAIYNSFIEYHYLGRTEEIEPERDIVYIAPIYDYWW